MTCQVFSEVLNYKEQTMTTNLGGVIDEYLEYISVALNRSPHTIDHYRITLHLLLGYLGDRQLSEIKERDVFLFTKYLKGRPGNKGCASPFTVEGRMHDVKAFFRWAGRKYKTIDPDLVVVPCAGQGETCFLEPREFQRIRSILNTKKFEDVRLRASIETLFSTGCRINEFLNLKREDVLSNEIIVKGKGGKYGTVYLNKDAKKWLERYLDKRTDKLPHLWVTYQQGPARPLKPQTLQAQIVRLRRRAGIAKRMTPHTFRHTTATQLLRNGANLREVQKVLRHASIQTTEIYTHITDLDLRKAHRKYSRIG